MRKTRKYLPVIGLEIHVELKTKAKMFCRCSANHFQAPANTNICPVCLGLPGAMPYPNLKALEKTLLISLLLHCQINKVSRFERKHYFYPDLPKGYQLTQYLYPMGYNGYLEVNNKRFSIRRVHQEEDTAKLKHQTIKGKPVSLVDFNRSGVPLVEIVTEPVFHQTKDVIAFLKKLQWLLRFYQVSDCDMEKGSMRLEANISLKPSQSQELPSYKIELKNINSFRFLGEAIEYEIQRQTKLLMKGEIIQQETRGYNPANKKTFSQRLKEEAEDYHYLLEPDIPPIFLAESLIKRTREEMGQEKKLEALVKLGWPRDVIYTLINKKNQLRWWQTLENKRQQKGIPADKLGYFLVKNKGKYYLKDIERLLRDYYQETRVIDDDSQLKKIVKQVINNNPQAVKDYLNGKEAAIYFLLGQVRYQLGRVNIPKTLKLIVEELKNNSL